MVRTEEFSESRGAEVEALVGGSSSILRGLAELSIVPKQTQGPSRVHLVMWSLVEVWSQRGESCVGARCSRLC